MLNILWIITKIGLFLYFGLPFVLIGLYIIIVICFYISNIIYEFVKKIMLIGRKR